MGAKAKVGILGCGNIFPAYVHGCRAFDILEVAACADIDIERARARAKEFEVPKACTPEALLADPEIEIVVNLTVPQAHLETNLAAVEAGKNVHAEKPFALRRDDGRRVLEAAAAKDVLVGCAPDTFLGGGLQTCRKLIDDGEIGEPVAAVAFMCGHGPEAWHPNPDFFYKFGGGPLFDMGPYYLTALVHLLGPIRTVTGAARISFPERVATSEALYGHRISVDVPTHVAGVLGFEAGPVGTLVMSFDVWAHNLPRIEIYGSLGTLSVPDPNTFSGPVKLFRADTGEWRDVPLTHSADVGRGIGVADMAHALRSGRAHRASGQLAQHVLDVMQSLYDASDAGTRVQVQSYTPRPAPLPVGLAPGKLD